jgi:iron complex outermembrane receptor protein
VEKITFATVRINLNKMNKLYTILLFIFCLVSAQQNADAQAKNGSLKGTVTTSDNKPAAMVSVGLKGTSKGTMTDEQGRFEIKNIKPGSYTLTVTHVGLKTEERAVTVTGSNTTQFDLTISENASQLSDVVVTGNRSPNRKVVAVGKGGIVARDLPQAVQVIDSTVITDQQANRLADVIKNVNGIVMGENRGSVGESFFARGYTLGANNVLKNGARTSIGGSPEASTLESVEVLKGSAALLYGGVSGGAVVNLVTKKPKFHFGGEVSMRAGSYSQYKPIVDLYGPISKKIAFRVIATKENAKSFRDVVKTDRLYINPSLLYKISDRTELIVQGDYLKSNYTPDFGLGTVDGKIPDIGRNAFVNTSWAYNHTNTGSAQASLNHRFNENWKLNVIGAFQSYKRDYFGAERPQQTTAVPLATRALTRSRTQEYTYNQQLTLTGSATTGSVKHTLLFGGDADESRTKTDAFKYGDAVTSPIAMNAPPVNLLDPSTYATSLDIPYTRAYQTTTAPIYRMGAFAQDLISLTEKFKVLAGIRYTYQRTPKSSAYNEDTGVTTLANTGIEGNKIDKAFSPKFALIYQPLKTTSVYVSFANNFTSNTGIDINNNPMGPSIIKQYEAGVKNEFLDGRLTVNVTAYRIHNNRFVQAAIIDGNVSPVFREFGGETKSDGVEFDVTGKITKGLYFLAGYSYNYFRYTKTAPVVGTKTRNPNGDTIITYTAGITEGERIIGTTPHTANGTIFYTFSKGAVKGLKLGASGFYTGRRNMGFNTLKSPARARGQVVNVSAYTTVDLTAGYTYHKVSLLAKLSNITNELNYTVHENYSVNPIPPRMFSTTLSYRF